MANDKGSACHPASCIAGDQQYGQKASLAGRWRLPTPFTQVQGLVVARPQGPCRTHQLSDEKMIFQCNAALLSHLYHPKHVVPALPVPDSAYRHRLAACESSQRSTIGNSQDALHKRLVEARHGPPNNGEL